MSIISTSDKPILILTANEYQALDEFHQCAAIVLQRKGRAIIEAPGEIT